MMWLFEINSFFTAGEIVFYLCEWNRNSVHSRTLIHSVQHIHGVYNNMMSSI